MAGRILIVDDEKGVRDALLMILKYEDIATCEAENGRRALEELDKNSDIDLVLCDVKMPGLDGLDLLREIHSRRPALPVIMISGHGTVETAIEAARRGAYDFLEKPLERDRLLLSIRNALEKEGLRQANASLRQEIASRFVLIGESPAMLRLRKTIERVARSDAVRILVTGENGTGKELVARNLHLMGSRAQGPWVDVNCAAIPKELIESELFGHEKGSFTGAHERKIGKFELASSGTIFLDEIGDMNLEAQAKVLRVLEQDEVQRVGGDTAIPIDVRVIAATNKDLKEEVKEGRFREDLYYRLNVIPIEVPPLRERGDDIILLLQGFLEGACRPFGESPPPLDEEVRKALISRPWPGNVRQLKNFAERVALLGLDAAISTGGEGPGDSNLRFGPELAIFDLPRFDEFKQKAEMLYLKRKLEENGWNVKRTSELLGMQRSNLYKKIDRYALKETR